MPWGRGGETLARAWGSAAGVGGKRAPGARERVGDVRGEGSARAGALRLRTSAGPRGAAVSQFSPQP